MPKLTFLGHACFLLEDEGKETLLFDPFLQENPQAPLPPDQVKADYILLSHAHFDHRGQAYAIARAGKGMIITTADIAEDAAEQGLNSHGLNIGGKFNFPFGWVKCTQALHSAGIAGGVPCGFVVNYSGKNIYFAGDTGLFSDMKLIGELNPLEIALLPIGDNYTMGIDDAVIAASYLQARTVIPYHYNTWPLIAADPQEFKDKVEAKTGSSCVIIAPGKSYSY
ncbi:MAG: metal-dependent hydrolase [Bacillota bacterium]